MHLIEYIKGDSLLHTLDPRVKILLLFLLTITLFIVKNFLIITIIFVTLVLFWWRSGLSFAKFKTYIKFLLGLFIIIIVLQGIFRGGTIVLLTPIIPEFIPILGGLGSFTLEGLIFGVLISFRLLTLIIMMPLITMTTPVHLFALGLVKLGMSYKIAYTATTTINIIPGLRYQVGSIMDAQKLRGFTIFEDGKFIAKLKAYPSLLLPLVISAMRNAQMMGVAMDARAFGSSPTRTYVEDIRMKNIDWVVVLLTILYITFLLLFNFSVL